MTAANQDALKARELPTKVAPFLTAAPAGEVYEVPAQD